MRSIKKSTARELMVWLVLSADLRTGSTGATLTITASKNGGAFAAITPTVTERGNGWYSLLLTTSHTDTLGDLALHITAPLSEPIDCVNEVVAYDPQDATALGLSYLAGPVIRYNTAQAGGASTITLDAAASAVSATYAYEQITIVSGTGAGQSRSIYIYNGATKVATVNLAWTTVPDATSVYMICAAPAVYEGIVASNYYGYYLPIMYQAMIGLEGTAAAGGASTITFPVAGSAVNDYYIDQSIRITSGTGLSQTRRITGYVGATKVATVDRPWATVPDATSVFKLVTISSGPLQIADAVPDAVWDSLMTSNMVAGSMGEAMRLMLGLTQNNFMLDSATYSGTDLTDARIRIFADAAGVAAATVGGVFGDEDEVAGYTIAATYASAGKISGYKVSRLVLA